jgi:hypothetical protein
MEEKEYNVDQFNLKQFEKFAKEEDHSLEYGQDFSTRAQQTTIYTLFSELSLDKGDFNIDKISKLTKAEASDLIEQLLDLKDQKGEIEFEEDFEDYYGEIGEDLKF